MWCLFVVVVPILKRCYDSASKAFLCLSAYFGGLPKYQTSNAPCVSGVLQYVAVCCSVSQCVAVCCSVRTDSLNVKPQVLRRRSDQGPSGSCSRDETEGQMAVATQKWLKTNWQLRQRSDQRSSCSRNVTFWSRLQQQCIAVCCTDTHFISWQDMKEVCNRLQGCWLDVTVHSS